MSGSSYDHILNPSRFLATSLPECLKATAFFQNFIADSAEGQLSNTQVSQVTSSPGSAGKTVLCKVEQPGCQKRTVCLMEVLIFESISPLVSYCFEFLHPRLSFSFTLCCLPSLSPHFIGQLYLCKHVASTGLKVECDILHWLKILGSHESFPVH